MTLRRPISHKIITSEVNKGPLVKVWINDPSGVGTPLGAKLKERLTGSALNPARIIKILTITNTTAKIVFQTLPNTASLNQPATFIPPNLAEGKSFAWVIVAMSNSP
jgi:hypothetical protein